MKYIDTEKLKAKLDEHYRKYQSKYMETRTPYTQGLIDALDLAEQTIDSLQQEKPEVDLEKEIDACWQNWLSPSNQKEVEGVLPKTEFAMYAHHFAEWMTKQGFSQEETVEDKTLESGYDVLSGIDPIINLPNSFKPGDKVIVQIRKIE